MQSCEEKESGAGAAEVVPAGSAAPTFGDLEKLRQDVYLALMRERLEQSLKLMDAGFKEVDRRLKALELAEYARSERQ